MDKAPIHFTTALPSGHTLTLRKSDITDEAVGAIVNAANTLLSHGGGVAGAIVRKGGKVIQEESNRIGRVKVGNAAITGAGRLSAQHVIHAVGPIWRTRSPEENDRLLASATTASLEIARQRGLGSIAFPAISSGIFGFPKDRCAMVMIDAVARWVDAHPTDKPRDLRFTIIDEPTVALFDAELRRRFAESD